MKTMTRTSSQHRLSAIAAVAAGLALAGAPALACEKAAKAKAAETAQTIIQKVSGDHAEKKSTAAITIHEPWTRATPPGAKVAGGFATLENPGDEADRLIGGSFELSERVEIHEMKMADGVMRMSELENGLELPAGGKVVLKPGSFHLMFMGLTGAPKAGETVSGTLVFERAGAVPVTFQVAPIGARSLEGSKDDAGQGSGHHSSHGSGKSDHGHHMKH